MNWFWLIKTLLGLAVELVRWVERRELLDAGQRLAVQQLAEQANEKITTALAARRRAESEPVDPDSLRDDPFNRDDRSKD